MSDLKPGLHERIVTEALDRALPEDAERRSLGGSEAARRLSSHFGDHLQRALGSLTGDARLQAQVALVNELVEVVERHTRSFPAQEDGIRAELLTGIGAPRPRPQLPLSESGLYVNANRERRLERALHLELESADHVDLICAFLFWQGFLALRTMLLRHLEEGRGLRVLTTTYRAVTDQRVLDELAGHGAEIRVSYETGSTRLHAKAWLLRRDSGFSTAFVGSSNLSKSALTTGLEWNVRLSAVENRAVLRELEAAFENHWADPEFVPYDANEFAREIRSERRGDGLRAVFTLRARPFQQVVLDRLSAERTLHERHSNLVVSATGTGKTVMAALDYARLCGSGRRLRLLFVAHRQTILKQSRDVFRHAMSDGSFGELWVDGQRPLDHDHVFASVQSLRHANLDDFAPDHFDVVIVDEFHHAAAKTYRDLLEHFRPRELLGLTATPERHDQKSILHYFDGRIASELRLWDAIDRGLLVPFQYFAVHDGTDWREAWRGGRFDDEALEQLFTVVTGHEVRAHLIVEAIRQKVLDATRMRALAFCVGVGHAHYMQRVFEAAGIPCAVIDGGTPHRVREDRIRALRNGELACLLSVDVFNEGVDIPEVDTLLLLRPTDSATLFLQQLGRGLRHAGGKRCLTVLDFVGQMHADFRFLDRLRPLMPQVGRKEALRQVQLDFPWLPTGCSIVMDRASKEAVLDNIAKGLKLDRRSLTQELKNSGLTSLADFLEGAGLELAELYRGGRCFTELRRGAGHAVPKAGPLEGSLAKALGRLIHCDDRPRLRAWSALLDGQASPGGYRPMLLTTLLGAEAAGDLDGAEALLRGHPAIVAELRELIDVLDSRLAHATLPWLHPSAVPLQLHAHYRLNEVMSALGDVRGGRLYLPREGVCFHAASQTNLLFVTLVKDEDDYSPTTLYADYALDAKRFHWQSQSGTRPTDKKGQRHIHHGRDGITPLLFVRETRKDERNETQPYQFLGAVTLVSWTEQRPMNIVWELDVAMPAATLKRARVVG